jgi:formylglycine-generating enzyme required for sulfatase activity
VDPQLASLARRLEELSAQVEELREGIRQSVTIAAQDPEMSLTRARKVLEYMLRDVYERKVGEPAGTRPLENLVQRLVKDGHLPKRLAAYANAIRELGNVGTHGFGEGVTPQDVFQSLTQLVPLVEWYFQQRGPAPAAAVAPRADVLPAGGGDQQMEEPREPAGRPGPAPRPARRRWAWLALGAGAGLCAVLVWWTVLRPSPGTPATATGPVAGTRPALLDCTGDGVRAEDVRRAQEAWAKYLGRQVEESVEVAEGVGMTFVLVPPGKFRMGSPEDEKERATDEDLHEVTLTEPFDLGKTEVTQAQYQALTGANPSEFKGADRPVQQVSWEEAGDCAAKLTKERDDRHLYRLPTEAEWEYSCRGGRPVSQPFGIGDGRTLSSREANFNGFFPYGGVAEGPYLQAPRAVGSYPANALGLFDMHGNVAEWCQDRSDPSPPPGWPQPGPPGTPRLLGPGFAPGFSARVYRGGCWLYSAGYCRAARRGREAPSYRSNFLGFRLARSLPPGTR